MLVNSLKWGNNSESFPDFFDFLVDKHRISTPRLGSARRILARRKTTVKVRVNSEAEGLADLRLYKKDQPRSDVVEGEARGLAALKRGPRSFRKSGVRS
jgi:hypothetical protein